MTSHSTCGAQASESDTGGQSGAAAEYSRIGPSYETTVNSSHSWRQQPVSGRNRVSGRLSERYEFSEPHLAMISAGGGGGGVQGEAAAMDYEVPLQSGEHEEYSHLRHCKETFDVQIPTAWFVVLTVYMHAHILT